MLSLVSARFTNPPQDRIDWSLDETMKLDMGRHPATKTASGAEDKSDSGGGIG
jgi:hypothetical protein